LKTGEQEEDTGGEEGQGLIFAFVPIVAQKFTMTRGNPVTGIFVRIVKTT
jgi:hypothetical protein